MDDIDVEERSLGDYAAMVKRRWRAATVGFLVVFVFGAGVAMLWPPVYRSIATILIEQQEIPQDLVRSTISSFAAQRIQLINQRVMTTANLLDIIRKHGLYAGDFERKPREVIIDRMRDDIQMKMISADVVDPRSGQPTTATIAFTVAYENRSPQLAARVANELTSLYLQQNSETRRQQAAEASTFLTDEAKRLSDEIAALEGRLAEFKQANVDRLPELAGLNLQLLNRTEQDLSDVQRERASVEERRVYLQSQLAQLNPGRDLVSATGDVVMPPADRLRALESYLASVKGIYTKDHPDIVRTEKSIAALRAEIGEEDDGIDERAQELDALRGQRDALLDRYEPFHPDVVRLDRQIAAGEEALQAAREAKTERASGERATNPAYVQLQAQLASEIVEQKELGEKEKQLKARLADLEARIAQTPAVERDSSALARSLESARLKYREVSAKQQEAIVAQNLEMDSKAERFQLIEPPLVPQQPVSPNRGVILLLSAVLAVAASIAAMALREATDSSVRDFKELRALGLVPLGIIPAILTQDDRRTIKRRRFGYAVASLATVVVAVVLAHFFVAPLDLLWFAAMRRLGV